MNRTNYLILSAIILQVIISFINENIIASPQYQDDTVKAVMVRQPPVFDGKSNDSIWSLAKWQPIDENWVPYGFVLDSIDFKGKYKVAWNPDNNLLYFFVDIIDDYFIWGYDFASDPNYAGYDCIQLFIDEDRSMGRHMNNHNAFGIFITGGNKKVTFDAIDLGKEYVEHLNHIFPNLARHDSGVHHTWEFALEVHNETYNRDHPARSRELLLSNKIMGLTMAYRDNDSFHDEIKEMDNLIGSVEVSEENKNSHWLDASLFGVLKLMPPENNQPPILLKKIEDIIINGTNKLVFIDKITNLFKDPEGLRMEYYITASDSTLKAKFIGDHFYLKVAPDFDGFGKVILNATDGDKTARDTFYIAARNVSGLNDYQEEKNHAHENKYYSENHVVWRSILLWFGNS